MYRRHTNFAIETIEQPLNQTRPGGRDNILITRNGDLCTNMILHVELPALSGSDIGSGVSEIAYVKRLGHALINNVDIEIGGSRIDRHWGFWLDIWYELTHTATQERGYRALIGDVPALTALRPVATGEVLPAYSLYVPLQFWFCRNTGLALPLIALQYHEVRINLELNSVNRLFVWRGTTGPNLNSFSFRSAGIMVDYVYLDTEERRRFAQVGHEYLIEQLQYPNTDSLTGGANSSVISYKNKLTFNHPCKEIIWALQLGAFNGASVSNGFTNSKTFLAYNDDETSVGWSDSVTNAAQGLAESMIRDSNVAGTVAVTYPLGGAPQTYTMGSTTVTVSFDTENVTGGSITTGSTVAYLLTQKLLGTGTFDFMDHIQEADLTLSLKGTNTAPTIKSVDCTGIVHTVSLRDLSIPLEYWAYDNRQSLFYQSAVYGQHITEYHVIQPHNYGVRLDGFGNPVSSGNIQLNGHDRFDVQTGQYFNYIQTQVHTRTPADGINVYSFALHPEQHQPSGTANLSRIDTTQLNLTIMDPIRTSTNGAPKLDLVTDTQVYVFATNYNVLRIMSGMAGLAYSN